MYKIEYKDASPIGSEGLVGPEEARGEASVYSIILSTCTLSMIEYADALEPIGEAFLYSNVACHLSKGS